MKYEHLGWFHDQPQGRHEARLGIQVGKHKARCGGNFVSLARGTDGPGQQASLPHRSNGTLRSRVYGMCARRTNRHDSLSSEYSIACDYGISAQAPRSKLCLAKRL